MQAAGSADAAHLNSSNTYFVGAGEANALSFFPPIISGEDELG